MRMEVFNGRLQNFKHSQECMCMIGFVHLRQKCNHFQKRRILPSLALPQVFLKNWTWSPMLVGVQSKYGPLKPQTKARLQRYHLVSNNHLLNCHRTHERLSAKSMCIFWTHSAWCASCKASSAYPDLPRLSEHLYWQHKLGIT